MHLISRIFIFLNELFMVLLISAPIRIALSFEIVEIKLVVTIGYLQASVVHLRVTKGFFFL